MTLWLWIIGGLYLAALVFATIHSRRHTQSADDYVLAGSNVGLFLGFLTFSATVFSTFTLMGMPDFFRTHGVGAWIFLAVSDGAMVFLILALGIYLRRRVAEKGFKGMSGLLSDCYGRRWGGYVYFAGAFLFLVPYVAIQIRGIGIFLEAAFPQTLPFWGWATLIVVVMLVYSEIGGLKAIIFSDAMQGLLLMIVTWIVALGCIRYFGGVGAMFEQVGQVNEALLSTPGPNGLFSVQFLVASFFAILMYPFTQPQVAVRIVIMKDDGSMRRMAVAVGVFAILLILATIPIGIVEQVGQVNEALLSTPGPNGLFSVQFLVASFFAILMYPFTQPQVAVRIVIMKDDGSMRRMAVAVGVFAILLILATIPIGMYGAVRYADLSVSDFLVNVLMFDQAPIIGATVAIGLVAAAMSTADSQIFALGAEVRSLISGTERAVMLRTKLAIVFFAVAALVFALLRPRKASRGCRAC